MKKLLIFAAFALMLIPMGLNAQTHNKFFGYLPRAPETLTRADGSMITWAFRPAVTITGVQLMWNKEVRTFESSGLLASAGIGVSLAHLKTMEGMIRSDYGLNLLYLFNSTINGESGSGSSVVMTVSAFEIISFGGGYNFGARAPIILIGATYNFNRPLN